LRNGQAIPLPVGTPAGVTEMAVVDEAGELKAVAEVDAAGALLRPGKVFA
jgi:hypothetical protein